MAWQKDFRGGGDTRIYQVFMKTGARTVSLGLKQYRALPPPPLHAGKGMYYVLRISMWGAVERRCD